MGWENPRNRDPFVSESCDEIKMLLDFEIQRYWTPFYKLEISTASIRN